MSASRDGPEESGSASATGGAGAGEASSGGSREARGTTTGDGAPSWSRRVRDLRAAGEDDGGGRVAGDGTGPAGGGPAAPPGPADGVLDEGIEQLRRSARRAAREDADRDLPASDERTERERSLRERCRSLYERWTLTERRRLREVLAEREEQVSRLLGRAGLLLDRFERMINQLIRLKARRSAQQRELDDAAERDDERERRGEGISTRLYVAAISFLGLVEFFANAPVFSTLLPRDPLTERQISVIAETSTGWLAGVERVLAQLVLRPDAALLAAGVITFLCVLAHFFGHSLRELVMKKDSRARRDASASRSAMENVVPMVLTGLGLVLVLGVLFQARVILGEVGERRYQDDMAAVSELRREAGWLRTDGELLEANQLADRADDMEEAATRLREYATSMSRMTWPILLLNITLVLAAITAAYFHRRDGSGGDRFGDDPWDDDRDEVVEAAEATASEISDVLSRTRRPIRELDVLSEDGLSRDAESVIRRLEEVIDLYRRENARARETAPESVPAFRGPVELGLAVDGEGPDLSSFRRAADEAEDERRELSRRFREARDRFNEHLRSWEADGGDA